MLFSSSVRKFLHSTIRSNHCFAIIAAIVRRDSGTLSTFTERTKRFLSERKASIFPIDREKYLTFMEYMRKHAPESELLDDEYLRTNEYVFKLYHLPKKRNNFLLFFLVGYYVSHAPRARKDPLLQSIYLYCSIITYRCRLSEEMRAVYSALPNTEFVSHAQYLRERYAAFLDRLSSLRKYAMVLAGAVFGGLAGFMGNANFFQTITLSGDAQAAGLQVFDPSTLLYTFVLGDFNDDAVQQVISSFSLEKIFFFAMILFVIQAVRGNFKDLFIDCAISKAIALVMNAIKAVFKTIFAAYSYIVWQITTRYIFAVMNQWVVRKIVPSVVIIVLFALGYFLIHAAIVSCYAIAANVLFGWYLTTLRLGLLIFAATTFTIGMNFYADKKNFEEFLLEINTLYEHLGEDSVVSSTPAAVAESAPL